MKNNEKLGARPETQGEYEKLFTDEDIDRLFGEIESYYIDPEKCQSCGICARKCPVDAITGTKKSPYIIDQDKCIKCGTCLESCPPRFSAINKHLSRLFD